MWGLIRVSARVYCQHAAFSAAGFGFAEVPGRLGLYLCGAAGASPADAGVKELEGSGPTLPGTAVLWQGLSFIAPNLFKGS